MTDSYLPPFAKGGLDELIYESDKSQVFRVHLRQSAGTLIRKDPAGLEEGAAERLRHEGLILESLEGVVGVPRLAASAANPTGLWLHDVGGEPLTKSVFPLEVPALLKIACRLCAIVGNIHRRGVIHQDINPSNILLCGEDQAPLLIDFNLATTSAEAAKSCQTEMNGTLAYMAPEQTGRMGRRVDQRADLYALGATLYELATGSPPFGKGDPAHGNALSLIHDHLAKIPESPIELNPKLPKGLSDVIMRLLQKEPDRRYHGADGLLYDLEQLANDTGHNPKHFTVGQRDFPYRLIAPEHLIGRKNETDALVNALDKARANGPQTTFVSGAAGVGKSALVRSLAMAAAAGNGWYVSGKFDRQQNGLEGNANEQAFKGLARLLLAEPETSIVEVRHALLAALGDNAALVATFSAEYASLLDLPSTPLDEGETEIETRLVRAQIDILQAIATPDRPLVIVLDDMQWAPPAGVAFFDSLLQIADLPGLLVVGVYTEPDVDANTAFATAQQIWNELPVPPQHLQLENLSQEDIETFLGEILRLDASPSAKLAAAIMPVSGGNPYTTVELVNAMRKDGALLPMSDGWVWDDDAVREYIGAADVSELLTARLARLPDKSLQALRTLACLGGHAQLGVLVVGTGLKIDELVPLLTLPIKEGLIAIEPGDESSVRFDDERLRQATYDNMDERTKQELHLSLARRLRKIPILDAFSAEQYLMALSVTADGANAIDTIGTIGTIDEQRRVAKLLRKAAARLRLTYQEPAERYLSTAIALLRESVDEVDIRLVADLNVERHTILCSLGRMTEADALYETIRQKHTGVQAVEPACVQMVGMANRGLLDQAIALGMDVLATLGVVSPDRADVETAVDLNAVVNVGAEKVRRWASTLDPGVDATRDEPTDLRVLGIARLLRHTTAIAAFYDPVASAWLLEQSQDMWKSHGPCADLVASITSSVSAAAGLQDDNTTKNAVTHHMLAVAEQRSYAVEVAYVNSVLALVTLHWTEPLEAVVDIARRSENALRRSGDQRQACFAQFATVVAGFECTDLTAYAADIDSALTFSSRTGNEYATTALMPYQRLLGMLRDNVPSDRAQDGQEADDALHATISHVCQALSATIFDDPSTPIQHTAEAIEYAAKLPGLYLVPLSRVLRALALTRQVQSASGKNDDAVLREIDAHYQWLLTSVESAQSPVHNFTHFLRLIEAERAWAVDDFQAAARAFDSALEVAATKRHGWHRALVAERAASFHHAYGLARQARQLLVEASTAYESWGATAKVAQLQEKYPFIRSEAVLPQSTTSGPASAPPHKPASVAMASGTTFAGTASDNVDLLAVLEASRTLSSETSLDALRRQVSRILGAMTGATTVHVVLRNNETDGWTIAPGATDAEPSISVEEAAERGIIPLSPFQYAARSGVPLLIDDGTVDDRFRRDRYFANIDRCSLLLVPIAAHGTSRAMLVLENRLSAGVFTVDRLDTVSLIAQQLAISLDNALAERFRSLVQRSSELTLVSDGAGVISYASSASLDVLGIDDQTLIGMRLSDVIDEADADSLMRGFAAACEGRSERLECRTAKAPDGSFHWLEMTFTNLLADPAVAGLMIHLRDITERYRLETELRQAQKLESVGILAAGLAHEINTPIQTVISNLIFMNDAFLNFAEVITAYRALPETTPGVAEILTSTTNADTDYFVEEMTPAIEHTIQGVNRIATIVQAMRTFGEAPDVSAPVDMNNAIRNTLVVANSQVEPVADVVLELGEIRPVECSLSQMNQVLLHLLTNASQAIENASAGTGRRGTITVRTFDHDNDLVIEVQDTGTGIADQIADRVFEPFFTTRDVGYGTGQGLAVVHSSVSAHGGTVKFATDLGKGTTFTIRLPRSGVV